MDCIIKEKNKKRPILKDEHKQAIQNGIESLQDSNLKKVPCTSLLTQHIVLSNMKCFIKRVGVHIFDRFLQVL